MSDRHVIDTSDRYDRNQPLPASRDIEVAGQDPVQRDNPRTVPVKREPYLASAELEDAVNLAIATGRPLLLQGDPGAGKTRLAHHVAYAFGYPLEEAYIKSTTRGQDLLYTYDAVKRLYDVQLTGAAAVGGPDVSDAHRYVRLGPLGRAIARAQYGRKSVVLIDEIDKADLDFPNDLLRELDRPAFEVAEAPQLRFEVPADRPELRPIVIVTNNEEKALPGAFLRRCIFHYVEFPSDTAHLDEVLRMHGIDTPALREETVNVLLWLRGLDLAKRPGLSELLDWAGYLQAVNTPLDRIALVPHIGALLKQRSDQLRAESELAVQERLRVDAQSSTR